MSDTIFNFGAILNEVLQDEIRDKDAEIERLQELFRKDGEQHAAAIKEAYKTEVERLQDLVRQVMRRGCYSETEISRALEQKP